MKMKKYFYIKRFLLFSLLSLSLAFSSSAEIIYYTVTGAASGPSVISNIQNVSITIGTGQTSNTATITSVSVANTIIIPNGNTASNASDGPAASNCMVVLTNSTTVTASVGVSGSTEVCNASVITFSSGVNSIQSGVITVSSGGSSTATLGTSVGANAFVILLGATSANFSVYNSSMINVVLTNPTTVTANVPSGSDPVAVGWMVADLGAGVVSSIQTVSQTISQSGTSIVVNNVISTPVVSTSTVFINDGALNTVSSGSSHISALAYADSLVSNNVVTGVCLGVATNTVVSYYTLVSFNPVILAGPIQRGILYHSNSASDTVNIGAVNTKKTALNILGNTNGVTNNDNAIRNNLTLTSSSVLTATMGAAGTGGVGWEVWPFN